MKDTIWAKYVELATERMEKEISDIEEFLIIFPDSEEMIIQRLQDEVSKVSLLQKEREVKNWLAEKIVRSLWGFYKRSEPRGIKLIHSDFSKSLFYVNINGDIHYLTQPKEYTHPRDRERAYVLDIISVFGIVRKMKDIIAIQEIAFELVKTNYGSGRPRKERSEEEIFETEFSLKDKDVEWKDIQSKGEFFSFQEIDFILCRVIEKCGEIILVDSNNKKWKFNYRPGRLWSISWDDKDFDLPSFIVLIVKKAIRIPKEPNLEQVEVFV